MFAVRGLTVVVVVKRAMKGRDEGEIRTKTGRRKQLQRKKATNMLSFSLGFNLEIRST